MTVLSSFLSCNQGSSSPTQTTDKYFGTISCWWSFSSNFAIETVSLWFLFCLLSRSPNLHHWILYSNFSLQQLALILNIETFWDLLEISWLREDLVEKDLSLSIPKFQLKNFANQKIFWIGCCKIRIKM